MPTWAIVGIAAVITGVGFVVSTLEAMNVSQAQRWTLGQSVLAISVANLTVLILVLTALASVLRFRERRSR